MDIGIGVVAGVGCSALPQAATTVTSMNPSTSTAVCLIVLRTTLPLGGVYEKNIRAEDQTLRSVLRLCPHRLAHRTLWWSESASRKPGHGALPVTCSHVLRHEWATRKWNQGFRTLCLGCHTPLVLRWLPPPRSQEPQEGCAQFVPKDQHL